MKLNNRNTNICGTILFIAVLIYLFVPIFVITFETSYMILGTMLFFVVVLFSFKNPKIQDMLVKILEKLPIKLK